MIAIPTCGHHPLNKISTSPLSTHFLSLHSHMHLSMANSFNLPSLQLHKSHFLGHTHFLHNHKSPPSFPPPKQITTPSAKFNLYEILGGRGLCNGEEGLQQELKKPPPETSSSPSSSSTTNQQDLDPATFTIPEDGFEKELLGLTGGFPGGEKGLEDFIKKNPPPKKPESSSSSSSSLTSAGFNQGLVRKPKAPELPLLMPGMIAIVKNKNSPYYNYCGIVQRITDGKAGVLFEGGNWDRLISFKLNELERREKGPPMVSPRSVVLEEMMENSS